MTTLATPPTVPSTLVYFAYGSGRHAQEAMFSLLTAFHFSPPAAAQLRYVVYTDDPASFAQFGVEIRLVTAAELAEWMGGADYIHRRKTMVMIDALERYPGKVAFIDGDTYFMKSPLEIFDRVGVGRACLHVLEGRLLQSGTEADAKISKTVARETFRRRSGEPWKIDPNAPMWNTGVLALSSHDRAAMQDTLGLIDQLWAVVREHHIEQFATGCAFDHLQISGCRDVVFHYWPNYLRGDFGSRAAEAVERDRDAELSARAARAYAARPRPAASRRLKVALRGGLRALGVNAPGSMKSA